MPAWSVTGWITGLIPGAVLLKVTLEWRVNTSVLRAWPKRIASCGLKARKGAHPELAGGGGIMPMPLGLLPTPTVDATKLVEVSITQTFLELLFAT